MLFYSFAAHAPQAAAAMAVIVALPALLEIAPGAVRIYALVDTASCLNRKGEKERALVQYKHVLEAMSQ